MIDGKTETIEEWNTIIKDTVNKYTLLKENLEKEYNKDINCDDTQKNIYKKTLDNYHTILKQYSHYLPKI